MLIAAFLTAFSCRSGLPKRHKLPIPIRYRRVMTEDVYVAVIGPKLEELMFRPVPLIDHFLHPIFVIVQLEAKQSFVCFMTGVTLYEHPHGSILSLPLAAIA